MRLIVGLGNPGEKYSRTRHNTGFLVIDRIAEEKDIILRLENEFKAENGDFGNLNDRIKLAKPQTFMNDSGQSVAKLKSYYKLDTEDIWVIHDDIDLEFGKVKIVLGGSSAGHKGIQSIIDQIGTDQFWRIRVGVGRDEKIPTEDWVLMNFGKSDLEKLDLVVDKTADYVLESLSNGISSQSVNI
jgi:PTH1 family peptidyl-tRNA hydrolase